eukprot:3285951-Alexandrium_andersonii.AAC.1
MAALCTQMPRLQCGGAGSQDQRASNDDKPCRRSPCLRCREMGEHQTVRLFFSEWACLASRAP